MRRILDALRRFFFPAPTTPVGVRLMPYAALGVVTVGVLVGGAYAWDYTNSPPFCGTTCHTMPPEYTSYQVSPHANIQCVECHIGRGFIATQITRKAGDLKHVTALLFKQYEFPITAGELRPARETCEKCHYPEKFSDDKLKEIRHYANDAGNTPSSIFLALKTGGGSKRQGMGKGIHWHIENKILYYPTDRGEQTIPYVRVYNDDGSISEYTDISAGFDKSTINESQLQEMDCITCHNRITHQVPTPDVAMDKAMDRKLIDVAIPEIHEKGVAALTGPYTTQQQGLDAIAALDGYYKTNHADYYAANTDKVQTAIQQIQQIFNQSVYIDQKSDWNSHPNNVGHKDFPGCFRCHDGKHLDAGQQAVRLECNLCHSIPVVVTSNQFLASLELSRGPEPESHFNSNWIAMHRTAFNESCSLCHKTDNPGGTDNTSFCSNSACHGSNWKFAGLNAPGLAAVIAAQMPTPTPGPTAAPTSVPQPGSKPTYLATIKPIFDARCAMCHGDAKSGGLKVTTFADLMAGGKDGVVIVPGKSADSKLVQVQSAKHFANLSEEELSLVKTWIDAGAPEK